MTTYDGDVVVSGALSAGNIYSTIVRITPVPNVPTSVAVTGVNLRGSGAVQAQATAHTSVPGLRVIEVSVSSVTSTSCLVWILRTNATETDISLLMWRDQ